MTPKRLFLFIFAVFAFSFHITESYAFPKYIEYSVYKVNILSPLEQVRAATDKVMEIFKDETLSESAKKKIFRETFLPMFDFNEITRRVLALHWKANESRVGEFIPLFVEFLESTYVNRMVMDSAKGSRIVVMNEAVDGDFATVTSKIINAKGRETPVDYRLRFNGNEWKVYDIVVEGVSMVSFYRTQFNRIIQKSSFDGLLQELRNKIQELKNK